MAQSSSGFSRFFRRLWKYGGAAANSKLDEKADPKVQIEQAVEESQRRHSALTAQAAKVIGSQRQLEMKLARQTEDVATMQANATQALKMADAARAAGDEAKATQYEQTASTFATQLVSSEKALADLQTLHAGAVEASDHARDAVEQNARNLQGMLAQKTQLLTQLESAKMQEQVAAQMSSLSELAAPGDVPTLDQMREKIEARYANALGASDLASHSVEGQVMEVQKATLDAAAQDRLAQLRASMGAPKALK